jgi:hypothetical protein
MCLLPSALIVEAWFLKKPVLANESRNGIRCRGRQVEALSSDLSIKIYRRGVNSRHRVRQFLMLKVEGTRRQDGPYCGCHDDHSMRGQHPAIELAAIRNNGNSETIQL